MTTPLEVLRSLWRDEANFHAGEDRFAESLVARAVPDGPVLIFAPDSETTVALLYPGEGLLVTTPEGRVSWTQWHVAGELVERVPIEIPESVRGGR